MREVIEDGFNGRSLNDRGILATKNQVVSKKEGMDGRTTRTQSYARKVPIV